MIAGDFDTLKWPTSILKNGPPATNRSILLMRQEAWDGEEYCAAPTGVPARDGTFGGSCVRSRVDVERMVERTRAIGDMLTKERRVSSSG